ncbi:MAG: hypothetical protein ACX939_09170 [Hyphococcus sp.]
MTFLTVFQDLGLLEITIFGFIGANVALSAVYIAQRGLQRFANTRPE